jgi:hypothetical protein
MAPYLEFLESCLSATAILQQSPQFGIPTLRVELVVRWMVCELLVHLEGRLMLLQQSDRRRTHFTSYHEWKCYFIGKLRKLRSFLVYMKNYSILAKKKITTFALYSVLLYSVIRCSVRNLGWTAGNITSNKTVKFDTRNLLQNTESVLSLIFSELVASYAVTISFWWTWY